MNAGEKMAPAIPPDGFMIIVLLLRLAASISVLGALVLAIKLYLETDKGWYWFSLTLSALFFAISQWLMILVPMRHGFEVLASLQEISDILSAIFFAASCYGIYKTMKEIRKRVE
jgi:hypothetical protein